MQVREEYEMEKVLLNKIRKILNKHDPMGLIRMGAPEDEYNPEVEEIMDVARKSHDVDEFIDYVHEIFINWFTETDAGPRDRYISLSKDLYELFKEEGVI